MSSKKIEEVYQKKTLLEQILLRPDTYIGGVENKNKLLWIYKNENTFEKKEIDYNPGLYKLFDEILVNSSDNIERSLKNNKKMTYISVGVSDKEIYVENDGYMIPIQVHKEYNMTVPELIFGEFLSGSNYDDDEQRLGGGRNGYGAKLTNAFSDKFVIEIKNPEDEKHIKITWSKNMSSKEINFEKSYKNKTGSIRTTYLPSFKRFNSANQMNSDMVNYFKRRVYDIAGIFKDIKVYLNEEELKVHKFIDYVKMYTDSHILNNPEQFDTNDNDDNNNNDGRDYEENATIAKDNEKHVIKSKLKFSVNKGPISSNNKDNKDSKDSKDNKHNKSNNEMNMLLMNDKMVDKIYDLTICVTQSDGNTFEQVSFVNGINTVEGGTHVDYFVNQIVEKIKDKLSSNKQTSSIKPVLIKNNLFVFVNVALFNPAFSTQTKEMLNTKYSNFGIEYELPSAFIDAVKKSAIVKNIENQIMLKELSQLGDIGKNKKNNSKLKIPKLDDANFAGSKESGKCTLILTEGDSAKLLVIAGYSDKAGRGISRDYYGAFPLKGKLLNVLDTSLVKLKENIEISNVIRILGLKIGSDYEKADCGSKVHSNHCCTKYLRYGTLMIMSDQDIDGSHIAGLILNFMNTYWPNLIKQGYVKRFITPLLKVTLKNKTIVDFFSAQDFQQWEKINSADIQKIKYYKGLGTSEDKEAIEYFRNMTKHTLTYVYDNNAAKVIYETFSKKEADKRKNWLAKFDPEFVGLDYNKKMVTISDFINKEFINFSMYDNHRSIPSLVDGLKPSQRKILYNAFKRNLTFEIKVAQFASSVAENTAYHHGEQSLVEAIVGMATNFVGSNNINLLQPIGQFGKRNDGGKEHASARYIYTKLSDLTRSIFIKEDDAIVEYLTEEDQQIEPKYYVPIIPMVLVNGANGIGTGWSTFIPNHNPLDIIEQLINLINTGVCVDIHPFYHRHTGLMEKSEDDVKFGKIKYYTHGEFKLNQIKNQLTISELPVSTWTNNYKERLDKMIESDIIIDYKENHIENDVDSKILFDIQLCNNFKFDENKNSIVDIFKLKEVLNLSNMVLFDEYGKIKCYDRAKDIIEEFYTVRLKYYEKRKKYFLDKLKKDLMLIDNKTRFILSVVEGTIQINNKSKKEIIQQLIKLKFDKNQADTTTTTNIEEIDVVNNDKNDQYEGFGYLVKLPIYTLTLEEIEKLRKKQNELKTQYDLLSKKTIKNIYLEDLTKLKEDLIKKGFK